jgi:undecaprenyl-phosphate galactose phosphotransferase
MASHSASQTVRSLVADNFAISERRGYRNFFNGMALMTSDVLAMGLSLGGSLLIIRDVLHVDSASLFVSGSSSTAECLVILAAIFAYLATQGRYDQRVPFWSEVRAVALSSVCAALVLCSLGLLMGNVTGRTVAFLGLLVFPAAATLANRVAKALLASADLWDMPVIIMGNGACAARTEAALKADRSLGYKIVRRIDPHVALAQPGMFTLRTLLQRHQAQHMFMALDGQGTEQRTIIHAALQERVPFTIVPEADVLPTFTSNHQTHFGHDVVFVSYQNNFIRKLSQYVKIVLDVTLAAILIVVLSPVYLLVAALTAMDGGPVIFGHKRVGAGGKSFRCLKFRTMVVDADKVLKEVLAKDEALAAEWRETRKLTNDPRITRVGKILRKTSLDELPQLLNVLMLDMSLVGPRPIVENEMHYYGDHIAQYYATRPGLTGLWQVSGRSNTTYAQRVELDVFYVNNWTFWGDIVLLFKTIPAVLLRKGAR